MTEYLSPIFYGQGFSILSALILVLAAYGTGGALLRKLLPDVRRGKYLASFVIGLDLFALLFCAVLQLIPGQGTMTAVFLFFAIAGFLLLRFAPPPPDLRRRGRRLIPYLIPAAFAILFASFAFVYPSGWDDCVYQLAVPRRWAESGHLTVFRDLPYSGFPMLPQMLYTPLMHAGGILSVRIFYVFCLIVFYGGLLMLLRRFGKTAGLLLGLSVMLPLTGSLAFRDSYAELFIALNLLAAFRCASSARGILSGLFAGAMTAVKLSGALPALCLFLYELLKPGCRSRKRMALCFILTAGLFSGVFYLRPLIATGNPCYPYLAKIFTPEADGLSRYHHTLGTDRFGYEDPVRGFFLSFGALSLNSRRHIFDGSWGLTFLFWCLAIAASFVLFLRTSRGRRRIPAFFLPVLLFYAGWYVTSPQARFLLPGFVLAAIPGAYAVRLQPKRLKRITIILFAAALLLSADFKTMQMALRNCRALGNENGRLDLLYGRTGGEYLTACAMLRGELPSDRGLLLFEERTLYMPSGAVIGTPLFQDEYFADGDVSAGALLRTIRRGKFRWLLFRIPEYNPDLLPEMLQSCGMMQDSLTELVKKGLLKMEPAGGNYWIFRPQNTGEGRYIEDASGPE